MRVCQVKDHNLQAVHVCTYANCQIESRWNCAECLRNFIHKHDLEDYSHILPSNQILARLEQVLYNISIPQTDSEQELGKVICAIENWEKQLHEFKSSIKKLQSQTNKLTKYQYLLLKQIEEIDSHTLQFDKKDIKALSNPVRSTQQLINKYNKREEYVEKMKSKVSRFGQIANLQQLMPQIQKLPPYDNQIDLLIIHESCNQITENAQQFYEQKIQKKIIKYEEKKQSRMQQQQQEVPKIVSQINFDIGKNNSKKLKELREQDNLNSEHQNNIKLQESSKQ